MKNLGQLMKQAQEMQTKMAEMQQRLADVEITGQSAAGKGDMRGIKIDPSLINPADSEVLEDLIVAAHNDARTKVDAHMKEESSKAMGGLQLPPGFKMPF